MNPQPGEIWLADLGLAAKTRLVVIVSRQDPDPPLSSCTSLSPLSGEIVRMKCRCRGFRSLIGNR
jgi:mRNA-degrading endonuclease toxin of MazEF toxin-antitoxin module